MESILIMINFAVCLFLTGLIWTVQVVHYPTFHFIDEQKFTQFSLFHQRRISYIVMPTMLLDLFIAGSLMFINQHFHFKLNFFGIVTIFLITFFISVPLHRKLSENKDTSSINKLVISNWFRTVLWTLRSIILFSTIKGLI